MPFQVLDDPSRGAIGEAIGSSISTGLQSLVQHKLGQMQEQKQRQQTSRGLQALGYSPKEASELSHFDPQIIGEIAKRKLAEPGERAYANALGSILGQGQQQQQQQTNFPQVAQQQEPQSVSLNAKQKMQLKRYLESPKAKAAHTPEQLKNFESYLSKPEPVSKLAEEPKAPSLAGLNSKQATEIAKLGIDLQKQARKETVEAYKITKDERKAILDAGKSARQNIHDLDRLEELNKEGKLDTPGYLEFLKRSGLDIPALMNPESQEFAKIAQTFLRDAKTYLGSRISNFELEQFLKTVPSLSQTPEGRKRVIANLRRFNRVSLEYTDSLKKVIKDNNGVPPFDLLEKVDDRVEKKMDYYADQFKKDLAKPVPEGQNKLVTTAQTALGDLLGNAGKLAKGGAGAYTGYKVGRLAGPVGGGIGAILGGLGGLSGIL